MAKYTKGTDIWGNDVTYGPNGEKYTHGTDLWGNDVTYGPNGEKYTHGTNIWGNDVTYGSNGEKYTHGTNIWGNDVTYGPNGEKYTHGTDLWGNSVTYGPDKQKQAQGTDSLESITTYAYDSKNNSDSSVNRIENRIVFSCDSAKNKHDGDYYYRRIKSIQPNEKIILNISHYDATADDQKKMNIPFVKMRQYNQEKFVYENEIQSLIRQILSDRPDIGYIREKGWILARRHYLYTYYPDQAGDGVNREKRKEIIYFLKEDGTFALYTYEEETYYSLAGAYKWGMGGYSEDFQDCSIEAVIKVLDFEFYSYQSSDVDYYTGEEREWIESGNNQDILGHVWKGAQKLVIRKYPRKGEGLQKLLYTLLNDAKRNQEEIAEAHFLYSRLQEEIQAKKEEEKRREKNLLKWRNQEKRIRHRRKLTSNTFGISILFTLLFGILAILSLGGGMECSLFIGCAVLVISIYSYMDGLEMQYLEFLSIVFRVVFTIVYILVLEFNAMTGVYREEGLLYPKAIPAMLAGQFIPFIAGCTIGRRVSPLPTSHKKKSHSGRVFDIYIIYILMAAITVISISTFVPEIPNGIRFWKQYFHGTESIDIPQASVSKVKLKKQKVTIHIRKIEGVDGYQIKAGKDTKFKKGVKIVKSKEEKASIRKWKAGKCYVKVRGYKIGSENKKIYGRWSDIMCAER